MGELVATLVESEYCNSLERTNSIINEKKKSLAGQKPVKIKLMTYLVSLVPLRQGKVKIGAGFCSNQVTYLDCKFSGLGDTNDLFEQIVEV